MNSELRDRAGRGHRGSGGGAHGPSPVAPPTMAHNSGALCDVRTGIWCWSWGASQQGSLRVRRLLVGGARSGAQGDRSRAAPRRCSLGRRGLGGQPLNGE
jgi:hypothetical protein